MGRSEEFSPTGSLTGDQRGQLPDEESEDGDQLLKQGKEIYKEGKEIYKEGKAFEERKNYTSANKQYSLAKEKFKEAQNEARACKDDKKFILASFWGAWASLGIIRTATDGDAKKKKKKKRDEIEYATRLLIEVRSKWVNYLENKGWNGFLGFYGKYLSTMKGLAKRLIEVAIDLKLNMAAVDLNESVLKLPALFNRAENQGSDRVPSRLSAGIKEAVRQSDCAYLVTDCVVEDKIHQWIFHGATGEYVARVSTKIRDSNKFHDWVDKATYKPKSRLRFAIGRVFDFKKSFKGNADNLHTALIEELEKDKDVVEWLREKGLWEILKENKDELKSFVDFKGRTKEKAMRCADKDSLKAIKKLSQLVLDPVLKKIGLDKLKKESCKGTKPILFNRSPDLSPIPSFALLVKNKNKKIRRLIDVVPVWQAISLEEIRRSRSNYERILSQPNLNFEVSVFEYL